MADPESGGQGKGGGEERAEATLLSVKVLDAALWLFPPSHASVVFKACKHGGESLPLSLQELRCFLLSSTACIGARVATPIRTNTEKRLGTAEDRKPRTHTEAKSVMKETSEPEKK